MSKQTVTWIDCMYLLFEITNSYELTGVCSDHISDIVEIKQFWKKHLTCVLWMFHKCQKLAAQKWTSWQCLCLGCCFKQIKGYFTIQFLDSYSQNVADTGITSSKIVLTLKNMLRNNNIWYAKCVVIPQTQLSNDPTEQGHFNVLDIYL